MAEELAVAYSINSAHPADRPSSEHVERVLERARAAREAGHAYVETGDHHVVGGGSYLQNVPISGRLAGVFDAVATLFLLPLYHPVLVAEQAGTLAAQCDRFDFWCGLGYNEASFRTFGVPMGERVPRFEEAMELIRRLWAEESVTFEGEYYSVTDVSVSPSADPRICVGAAAKPAVERAARLGDAWVAAPTEGYEDLRRKIEWYEAAGGGTVILRRDAVVLEDGDEAGRVVDDGLAAGYRGWDEDAEWPLRGDVESVAAELERFADLGVEEVVVRPMSDAHAEETLERVADAADRL